MTCFDSTRLPVNRKLLTRLFSKIKISTEHFYKDEPCWDWIAYIDKASGYSRVCYDGKNLHAFVLFYRLFVEVTHGLDHDHLCRRRKCVNPVHIEAVSRRVNVLRGESPAAKHAQKTHCPKGHPYSGDNLRLVVNSNQRQCRACHTEYKRQKRTS